MLQSIKGKIVYCIFELIEKIQPNVAKIDVLQGLSWHGISRVADGTVIGGRV